MPYSPEESNNWCLQHNDEIKKEFGYDVADLFRKPFFRNYSEGMFAVYDTFEELQDAMPIIESPSDPCVNKIDGKWVLLFA